MPAQENAGRNASGGELSPEQACFDVQHYELRIEVDPAGRRIAGRLAMRADATAAARRIALDLDAALAATAVTWDGTAATFARQGHRLWIDAPAELAPGTSFTVAVDYGGVPRTAPRPPWEGGFTWAETKDGKPWIATSCQGEGADLWWPCKDHPSDKPAGMDLFVTVPKGLVVASNGTQQGKPATSGGKSTFHWRIASPISNYCVALNIAPYRVVEDSYTSIDGTKVPVQFFALPENEAKARRILPQFLDHVRAFEEMLGPYPFRHEKYGIAETPHLGMEHQTILAYGNRYADMAYDWLHNHELAHEWWGNLVTCRDWSDMWIHEGFGSYMQPLYLERRRGRDAYLLEMRRIEQRGFVNRIPVAPRRSMDSHEVYFANGGSNDIYFKGAWVLHTLRWELGDEVFFRCLRRFCYPDERSERATDGSQVRLVATDDFVALCSELAGRDLGWFFDVYVRQPALPELVVERDGADLVLRWRTPDGLPFPLAVPVQKGGRTIRVPMPDGKGRLANAGDAAIDPERLLLMRR